MWKIVGFAYSNLKLPQLELLKDFPNKKNAGQFEPAFFFGEGGIMPPPHNNLNSFFIPSRENGQINLLHLI